MYLLQGKHFGWKSCFVQFRCIKKQFLKQDFEKLQTDDDVMQTSFYIIFSCVSSSWGRTGFIHDTLNIKI